MAKTPAEIYEDLNRGARLLALQRMVVELFAAQAGCTAEVADARFQEEWDRSFETILGNLPSHLSALTDELRQTHQSHREKWLRPECGEE